MKRLIDIKNDFLSVRVKLTIGLFLTTAILVCTFGLTAWEHYQNQQSQLEQTSLDNHAQEYTDQLDMLSSSITYLFEAQTLFSQAADITALQTHLNSLLPELQWLLPIVNSCVGSKQQAAICSSEHSIPPAKLMQQVHSKLKPGRQTYCEDKCYLWISLPIRLKNSNQGILAFQLELSDALINVTRRDNIELALIDLALPTNKAVLVSTSTQVKSHKWFELAAQQLDQDKMLFSIGEVTIVGQLYPLIDGNKDSLRLLILKDWSHQLVQEQNFEFKITLLLITTTIISIALGLFLMSRPIASLRYHTINLPKILDGQQYFRHDSGNLFQDEFDSLDKVSSELADNFKTMKDNIEANTKELEYMAMYDPLTGLANRSAFNKTLERLLDIEGQALSLLYVDIDNFKTINDTLGHDFGDQLIEGIAKRIKQLCGDPELVFRLGGDEFTLILLEDDEDQCIKFADSITRWAARDMELSDITISATLSVGIASAKQAAYSQQLLVKYADLAMYASKRLGRNRVTYFDIGLAERNDLSFAIDTQFREALQQDQIELYLQPQVSMCEQRIIGFELLLRWNHPTRGLLNPGHFLDIVENGRHVFPLGYWVVDRAIKILQQMDELGYSGLSIAFNISGRQFEDKNFTPRLIRKFKALDHCANTLELEITESAAVQGYSMVRSQLDEIREAGIHVAFDDFGKGFTSLSYLSNLACDKIKFDREFGYNATACRSSQQILVSMLELMKQLDYKVLVEGVETKDHANWLIKNGFDKVQGYLFGKPLPLDISLEKLAMSEQESCLFDDAGIAIALSPSLSLASTTNIKGA